ncbi:hypothetical protein AB0O80_10505 [Rothia kristinae]|uniref:hypothetical protein n=1 Tax=Actinomycetes TaxID=1760 RepID=UPI0034128E53
MDHTDALLTGLLINEEQGLGLTPGQIRDAINRRLNTSRHKQRPTITYQDPTGNEAAARADRSRR